MLELGGVKCLSEKCWGLIHDIEKVDGCMEWCTLGIRLDSCFGGKEGGGV